jgi:uroporphyrinogen III methyltransferase/synthase
MSLHTASATQRRVLLTRSEEDCAEWEPRFRERGAEPVCLPCIRCEVIDTPELRAELASELPNTDWLVFTSRRGVESFAALQPARHARWRVAVVGAATAAAARAELKRVDLVGRGGTAASLAETLVDEGDLTRHPRVLLAVAENAGDAFERTVAAAGAHCVRCNVYRTVPAAPTAKRPLSSLHVDNVVLASPSAVTGFMHQIEADVPVNVYTIGPSTTAAARKAGLVVTAEAREPSLEGILEAMQWRN